MKSQGFSFANEKIQVVSLSRNIAKFFGGHLGGGGLNGRFCAFESQIGQKCLIPCLYVLQKKFTGGVGWRGKGGPRKFRTPLSTAICCLRILEGERNRSAIPASILGCLLTPI